MDKLDCQTLPEFFRARMEEAQRKHRINLREVTQFYVVNLLSEFLDSKRLYLQRDEGIAEEPLALIYGRAAAAQNSLEQFRLFKELGDKSLYVSGFFGDSLKGKVVDIDYYIAMGENAYRYVWSLSRDRHQGDLFQEVFGELSEKFVSLVDLLSAVSESTEMTSDRDLLRLYERWLATKSERLSHKLKENGILPVECNREPIH